jgi:hypothetical protein
VTPDEQQVANLELLEAMQVPAESADDPEEGIDHFVKPAYPATPRLVALPPLDTDPKILAAFWLERGVDTMDYLRQVRARLTAHLAALNELPGLSLTWSYDYAPDAAAEFPGLVSKRSVIASVQTEVEFQQIVEFLAEFVPEAEAKFDLKIDNRAANSIILHRGAGGERLLQLRSETPRLTVKK